MKKVFLILCLNFGFIQLSQAQLQFGIKGGINYNFNSFSEVKNDILSGAKSKMGFHAGLWSRIKIPLIGLYIRPELVYTQLKNSVNYHYIGTYDRLTHLECDYKVNKIDIPILLGLKVLKIFNFFAGPSFQYILNSKFENFGLKAIKSSGFSFGLQFGGGVEIGRIGLDLRWERSLSDIKTEFLNKKGRNFNFNNIVNQIIIGLSYRI